MGKTWEPDIWKKWVKMFLVEKNNEKKIVIIGGVGNDIFVNNCMKIEIYNVNKRESYFVKNTTYSYTSFATCMMIKKNKHYIYLCGGIHNKNINDEKKPTNLFFLYVVEDNKLVELPKMNMNRMYHSMCISNENGIQKIYVFGGFDGDKIITKGEYFDGTKWKIIDFLNHPYCACSVFNVDVTTKIKGTFKDEENSKKISEGPVEIITNTSNVYEIHSKGNMSKDGFRHGKFTCQIENKEMKNFFYHENKILKSYIEHLQEQKLDKIQEHCKSNGIEILKNIYVQLQKMIYKDPVLLSSGNSYDRDSINQWLDESLTDPLTREEVENMVYPNRYIQKDIEDFILSIKLE